MRKRLWGPCRCENRPTGKMILMFWEKPPGAGQWGEG
jgi:hypothetical protein